MTDSGDKQRDAAHEPTSSTLLEGLRARCPAAWQRLALLYVPLVYGWCRRLGVREHDIPDVVQEVFQTVAVKLSEFRHGREGDTFRGWLWTITRYKVLDCLRRVATQPQAIGGSEALHWLAELESHESDAGGTTSEDLGGVCRRAAELIRSEFEPRSWQAFWRVVVDQQSPAEVGAALGISTGAVYTAKSRILRRFREELGDVDRPTTAAG